MNFKNTLKKRWATLDESWRFAITAFLIAGLFYTLWSWVILTVQPVAIQNLELSGEPILTIFSLKNSQAHIYVREVNGNILTFEPVDSETMIDGQTGTLWSISNGAALEGPYKGSILSPAKTSVSDVFPYHHVLPYQNAWLAVWQRFDANWYVSIAENGYGTIPGDDHFPPLFPLLIRLLRPLFGSAFLAGLFISHAATLYSLKLLYDVFKQWNNPAAARRALFLYLVYPTFFFLFSAYSEPVFLVVVLLAIRAMNARSWLAAGFWTFCAISTRLQGVALFAPMLYLMSKDQPLLGKLSHWMGLAVAGISGLFYLYLRSIQVTGGAVPLVESDWHARLVPPWETYRYALQTILSGNATFIDILNWAMVTLFVMLLVWGWRKIPLEYDFYTAFSLLIILIRIVETQPLISASRYMLTLFPCFFILSLAVENPLPRRVFIYTFIALHLYLSGQFFIWGWVA